MSDNSCVGCKFLFGNGEGYSNYTWMSTEATCALDKNANLPAEPPYDWCDGSKDDLWVPTKDSRCESYSPGPYIVIDPDREDHPAHETTDVQQIAAILSAIGMPDRLP